MSLMREFLRVLKVAHFTLAFPVDPGVPGIMSTVFNCGTTAITERLVNQNDTEKDRSSLSNREAQVWKLRKV